MKQKAISLILLLSTIFTLVPNVTYADAWGTNMMATIQKQIMEELYLQIKETIIANLKITAIRTIQGRLQTLLGGFGLGGPRFVTNWRDEIYGSAHRQADIVVNDYFSQLRSRTPGPAGQRIVARGEEMYRTDYTQLYPDIDKYQREGMSGSPAAFWRWWLAKAEIQNQPFIYSAIASAIEAQEYAEIAGSQSSKYQAYGGYKEASKLIPGAVTATGPTGGKYTKIYKNPPQEIITMPGSTIKDIVSEIQNMPTKMLTLARSIPEIVTSMVTQMITQMVQQGITQITAPIDKQLINFRNTVGLPIYQVQNYIQSGIINIPSSIRR